MAVNREDSRGQRAAVLADSLEPPAATLQQISHDLLLPFLVLDKLRLHAALTPEEQAAIQDAFVYIVAAQRRLQALQ